MELKEFVWQTTPRFIVTGSKQALEDVIELCKSTSYTVDDGLVIKEGDKLLIHLTHVSIYTPVSNGRLKELTTSNLLNIYLQTHLQFVQSMMNDKFKVVEYPSNDNLTYPVVVIPGYFMVEGFIYSLNDLQSMMRKFDQPIGNITNEEIVFDKNAKCFIIGCTTVSYNDCNKLLKTMGNDVPG